MFHLLLIALTAGCLVPKKQLDAALAESVELTASVDELQANPQALRALADELEAALEFHPLAPNDGDAGRAANRRTEIVLAPRLTPRADRAPAPAE